MYLQQILTAPFLLQQRSKTFSFKLKENGWQFNSAAFYCLVLHLCQLFTQIIVTSTLPTFCNMPYIKPVLDMWKGLSYKFFYSTVSVCHQVGDLQLVFFSQKKQCPVQPFLFHAVRVLNLVTLFRKKNQDRNFGYKSLRFQSALDTSSSLVLLFIQKAVQMSSFFCV